ncbi:hypothetical protein E2562_010579 [Oryza meyeriana var. granulata]|uniref:Retroviral polymerase SH3-like domain-containing protein n=1 Tax=Oryza meyeriana var. granulata TaxID=110450 RepID=A0A6G1BU01_9ORYZ|nr:hypothetical protein E2562_010579 [Oryza meyeriana var. granulata]
MVSLGYEEGSKAYRVYDPAANRVHVSRDVVFDEEAKWNWDDAAGGANITDPDEKFTVSYTLHPVTDSEQYPGTNHGELGVNPVHRGETARYFARFD